MFRWQSALCFLCAVIPLPAQQPFHLRGRIFDPAKRPVPKAAVTINDKSGSTLYQGAAGANGDFYAMLPPGVYGLTVAKSGFDGYSSEITIPFRDQRINISLQLKRESISVTVSDQATRLDLASDSHQDSFKLNTSQLSSLPMKDGDVLGAVSFFANPTGGQSPTLIVDGMVRTDSVTLTPSQVENVRLNNNAYSAEYPKPGKDRIEVDTKGGADSLHGGFTFRTRNSVFDARNPLAATKPPFARNGYEVNLSGPIMKRKLFFFLSADRENQQQVQPILAYLPSGVVNQQVLAPFKNDLLLGRLDYQITEAHRVSGKYEFRQDNASDLGVGGFVLPEAGVTRFHRDYRIELSDQYVLSSNMLNNFRLALGTNYESMQSQTDAPSIVVPGAFQIGGGQVNNWRREPRYEFQDAFSLVAGSLTIKAGADARLHPFTSFSTDNFGGTYQFASLALYQAKMPVLYTLNAGNALIVSDQDDYDWYLQIEKQYSRATIFAGVRHEFQSHFARYGNLAPRISTAVAIDSSRKTILRLGVGMFYDRRPPTILQQVERFNGINTQQYIFPNPSFPVTSFAGADTTQPTTLYQVDARMTLPRIYQASMTLERQLPRGFLLTSDFTFQRGSHLFRTRNINAPLPQTGLRPDNDLGNVNQIESSASSRGQDLSFVLKSPPGKRYQAFAQYDLSYQRNDTANVFGPPPPGAALPTPGAGLTNLFSLPVDNYNLRPEWGRASNDMRHRFGVAATIQLPWQFSLGTLTSVHSGLPYDITTGFDNNHDTDPNDRPAGFTRNLGNGASFFTIDVHLARHISFEWWHEKVNCELAADSFNVLNHTNLSNFVGVETSPAFGMPNAAFSGREMQFSAKITF